MSFCFGYLLATSAILASVVDNRCPPLCVVIVSLARAILVLRPFLHRHYSTSSILRRNPTSHRRLTSLLCIARWSYSLTRRTSGISRVTAISQCVTCQGLRPRGGDEHLAILTPSFCLLHGSQHRPSQSVSFRGSIPSAYSFRPITSLSTLKLHQLPDEFQDSLQVVG